MNRPIDFTEFWSDLRAEVETVEKDWDRIERTQEVQSRGKTWTIEWIRYSSIDDQLLQGWIAVPKDHPANGAGFLWLPGYSYGTPPPDDSNLVNGAVTFAINVHGNAPDAPYVNPAGKNDYILDGIGEPRTYIYRSIVAHCLCAAEVLSRQQEVTAGIGVGGMSQGGGLALLVAAQSPLPKICCADMPFLSDLRNAINLSHSPAYRKLKEYSEIFPQSLDVASLFDPLYHADRIRVPVWLSAGGKDPACKPPTVEVVYRAIAAYDKQYEFFPNAGHVFLPEMNEAYERMIGKYILAD